MWEYPHFGSLEDASTDYSSQRIPDGIPFFQVFIKHMLVTVTLWGYLWSLITIVLLWVRLMVGKTIKELSFPRAVVMIQLWYNRSQIREAASAAKSLQLYLALCNPTDNCPPGSCVPGILQARILEWVAISFSNAFMHAKSLQLYPTLRTAALRAPLSTGFSRQEYWNRLPISFSHKGG